MDDEPGALFRREAIEHRAQAGSRGALLRMSPAWTRYSYWLVVIVVVGAGLYAALGTLHEYAMGPALIRAERRREVTARAAGTVSAMVVQPGQRVAAGELLMRFHDADEAAEADRLEREFNLQLIKMLRDPNDQAARQSLTSLRAQKERAATLLEERAIKAPISGLVSDVRIRPGPHLNAG